MAAMAAVVTIWTTEWFMLVQNQAHPAVAKPLETLVEPERMGLVAAAPAVVLHKPILADFFITKLVRVAPAA